MDAGRLQAGNDAAIMRILRCAAIYLSVIKGAIFMMNKVVSHLGGYAYVESFPEVGTIKLYIDVGGAQEDMLFLGAKQIDALKKFLRDIEEECE